MLRQMDMEWVRTRYPKLSIDLVNNKLEGEFSFKIDYNGYRIFDTYAIKVDFNQLDSSRLPKVFEISGKIYDIARKHHIESGDLHINPDGSFCMVIPGKENELFQDSFTLQEFFENGIEKFLFQMSFFEKEGALPWGEYAHGYLGHIEYYEEGGISLQELISRLDKIELIQSILTNRQSICLCGSGEKLRNCHPIIFKAINKIKKEFNNGK